MPVDQAGSRLFVYALTVATFAAAGLCFWWYAGHGHLALLLLGLVTFGTAFDFLSHVLGYHCPQRRTFLLAYARINFAALCFGIPFTAIAGSWVIAAVAPGGWNAALVGWSVPIAVASVLFGGLFLVARYRFIEVGGAVELTLDKAHTYSRVIFIARRVYLAAALVIGIIVMVEGWASGWAPWSLAFGLTFIATVPLHIRHLQLPSMAAEAATLAILLYGSWAAILN
jgi:hypothetical protein